MFGVCPLRTLSLTIFSTLSRLNGSFRRLLSIWKQASISSTVPVPSTNSRFSIDLAEVKIAFQRYFGWLNVEVIFINIAHFFVFIFSNDPFTSAIMFSGKLISRRLSGPSVLGSDSLALIACPSFLLEFALAIQTSRFFCSVSTTPSGVGSTNRASLNNLGNTWVSEAPSNASSSTLGCIKAKTSACHNVREQYLLKEDSSVRSFRIVLSGIEIAITAVLAETVSQLFALISDDRPTSSPEPSLVSVFDRFLSELSALLYRSRLAEPDSVALL